MNDKKEDKPKKAFGEGENQAQIRVTHGGDNKVHHGPLLCGFSADRICLITSYIGGKQFFWGFMVGEVSRMQLAQFAESKVGTDYSQSIQRDAVNPDAASLKKAHVVALQSYLDMERQLVDLTRRHEESSVILCNCATVEILDAAIHTVESHVTEPFATSSSSLLSANQLAKSLNAAKNAF